MTHDKEKYRRACSLTEFLTQTAGAMEVAGELHESLSDRVYELIDPIRKDRDWLRFAGSFMIRGGPLPDHFDDNLDAVEVRAFDAVPKLRLMVLEAFERHV
jgi:hypothetical protein